MEGAAVAERRKVDNALVTALMAVKSTPRTGWMLRVVPPAIAETIAGHMAESALIALVLSERMSSICDVKLSPERAASIALIHDIAEAFVGDIVKRAADYIGKDLKESMELHVARDELGEFSLLIELLNDYIAQESVEARIAKAAEQFSTLLQGLRYLDNGYPVEEIVCAMYRTLSRQLDENTKCIYKALRDVFNDVLVKAEHLCSQGARA
jgi:putative hydrolase of HD superfamily